MTASARAALDPDITGFAWRGLESDADYAAIAAIVRAGSLADGLDYAPDAALVQLDLEHDEGSDPRRDLIIAEVDGEPVGFGHASRAVRDGLAVYSVEGAVHPAWRRRGFGRAIVRRTERHLRAMASGHADADGRVLGAWCSEREAGARELLAAEGYVVVRGYVTMIRRDLEAIPEATLPRGLELRAVRPEDHRAIFDAGNEAFRDHWGHREMSDQDFARLFATPDLDTALWPVAWAGEEVAGVAQPFIWRSENETLGVRRGWIEHVSVRRPWRRRGVATALVAESLRRLRAAGMTEAMLGVDVENPSDALGLYERLGFEPKERMFAWRKPWQPGGRLV